MKASFGLVLLVPVLLCCACLSGCGESDLEPRAEYRLTYNVFFPSSHAAAELARAWAAEVETRTLGRVRIDVYAGGVLSNDSENFNCVVFGATDLGMSCFAYNRGLFPLLECLDLPHGYRDGVQATEIANAFIEHFKPKELEDVELMYAHAHGPGVLASRVHVASREGIKELRLRGTGVTAMAINALGADAVGLSQGETYEALRKGVVQGTLCPIETLNGWKQGEVIEHVTKIPALGYTTTMFVAMNKASWEKLPADIQEIIRDINRDWIVKHGVCWDEMDADGEELVRSLGKSVHEFDVDSEVNQEYARDLAPLLERWQEQAEAKGLPGREALAFIRKRIESGESGEKK